MTDRLGRLGSWELNSMQFGYTIQTYTDYTRTRFTPGAQEILIQSYMSYLQIQTVDISRNVSLWGLKMVVLCQLALPTMWFPVRTWRNGQTDSSVEAPLLSDFLNFLDPWLHSGYTSQWFMNSAIEVVLFAQWSASMIPARRRWTLKRSAWRSSTLRLDWYIQLEPLMAWDASVTPVEKIGAGSAQNMITALNMFTDQRAMGHVWWSLTTPRLQCLGQEEDPSKDVENLPRVSTDICLWKTTGTKRRKWWGLTKWMWFISDSKILQAPNKQQINA